MSGVMCAALAKCIDGDIFLKCVMLPTPIVGILWLFLAAAISLG